MWQSKENLMKSILSASVCVAALAFAVPAMAATTDSPKHMHHHHMSKMGPKTHMKKAGDPTTAELNERSLNAARGSGSAPAAGDTSASPMTPPASSGGTSMTPPGSSSSMPMTPPASSGSMPMTQPSSGSTGTTAPNNAPNGG